MMPVTICWTQFGSPLLRAADLDHRHDRRAARTVPSTVPLPPSEAAAADDHRGDHVQLEADGDRRVADRQASRTASTPGDAGEDGRHV